MSVLVGLLASLLGLGSLACFIIVLVKLFQDEGVGQGILGLICGIYTFIWGWQNAKRLDINTIMLIWTILAVAALVLRLLQMFAFGATSATY